MLCCVEFKESLNSILWRNLEVYQESIKKIFEKSDSYQIFRKREQGYFLLLLIDYYETLTL